MMKYLLLAAFLAALITAGTSTDLCEPEVPCESQNVADFDSGSQSVATSEATASDGHAFTSSEVRTVATSDQSETESVATATSESQSNTSGGQVVTSSTAESVATSGTQAASTSVAQSTATASAQSSENDSPNPETKSAKCNGSYEFYDLCPPRSRQTCESLGYDITCPIKMKSADCQPACRCLEGYYRNQFGVCVPECECPPPSFAKCSYNETYSTCVNGGCFGATYCSEIGALVKCVKPKHCYQGCICKKGYLRDDDTGYCILEQECQAKTCLGPNEFHDLCPGCSPQTCASLGHNIYCPIRPTVCKPACRCLEGYYRNQFGICVPEVECPCIIGETFLASDGCNWCRCIDGIRGSSVCTLKACIVSVSVTCPPNEWHDTCPPQCLSLQESCASLSDTEIECPIRPQVCEPKCRCLQGFYRDTFGSCVPKEQCPKPCHNPNQDSCNGDRNAQRGCGINCGRLCSNYDSKEPIFCILSCDLNGCDCKKDYVFDEVTKMCVLPHECSRYKCNRPHEFYDPCPDCSLQTCETIFKPTYCPWEATRQCKGQCRCEPGYYRNKIGECIRKQDCLKCLGPHEYYTCGGACDNVCKDLRIQNQTSCPIVNVKCNEKCYCEEGHARDDQGICIPFEQCPVTVDPICGKNEELDNCYNGGCFGARTCAEKGRPFICIDLLEGYCEKGCVCIDEYLRDDRGVCIPEKQCPSRKCPGKYEEYTDCINGGCFTARKCSERGRPEVCVHIPPELCRPGCLCQKGYLRNRRGHCVPEYECPLVKEGMDCDDDVIIE